MIFNYKQKRQTALYLTTIIMTTTQIALENCSEWAGKNYIDKGFIAGDGTFWIWCADFQAATDSGLKYIFFKDGIEMTLYRA